MNTMQDAQQRRGATEHQEDRPMADAALKIRGLEKQFRAFKLGPLDITVPMGAIYGLVGPNGAGKTTTIDLVMGMGRKDAGTIEVFGMDHLEQEVAVKKRIGYTGPDLSFHAWGTVGLALDFVRDFYADWDPAYCESLLKRLKLDRDAAISELSFGARTKLGVVFALAHHPDLLLLDEPLAGLDSVSKMEVFTELLDAVQEETRTVLISSHNIDDIERFADHIGIIHDGRMLVEGPTTELLERFCMVDCAVPEGVSPRLWPGARIQRHRGDRWRILLDKQTGRPEDLAAHGITDIAAVPVTLEELLVALVREE